MEMRKFHRDGEFELNEKMAVWCDELYDGVCGSAYALVKLYDSYLAYYSVRVPQLKTAPALFTWEGECPFCKGRFEVDASTGWWKCDKCYRRGEPFGLEYLLFAGGDPTAWRACCQRVLTLMEMPPAHLEVEDVAC